MVADVNQVADMPAHKPLILVITHLDIPGLNGNVHLKPVVIDLVAVSVKEHAALLLRTGNQKLYIAI